MAFSMAQTADLLATVAVTSAGAQEINPLLHAPAAWVTGKVIAVTVAGITLWLRPQTLRVVAVLATLTTFVAVWNLTQICGSCW